MELWFGKIQTNFVNLIRISTFWIYIKVLKWEVWERHSKILDGWSKNGPDIKKAFNAQKAGNNQEACRLYAAILKLEPDHPDANHSLGVIKVRMGEVEASIPYLKAALEANFSAAQFWYSYIDALLKLSKFYEAEALLIQVRAKGAKDVAFDILEQKVTSKLLFFKSEIQRVKKLYDDSEFYKETSV